ncbi:MAG: hypothetical protein KA240_06420 [Nitrospira sp.]|nr:hypothetical protein [Nitrospira sp.]MBP6605300.1 hypothetical protein [Nitrospira sp.]HQY56923.1 hypothetical protein [Nitrospira sp.]HRA97594.1 hypothetical protein [Nitrospira sp.]
MPADDKWKANMEKVAYMKAFPGLLRQWEHLVGKTIEAITPLKSKAGAAALFCTDGSFVVLPPLTTEPYELGEALQAGRGYLAAKHPEAYAGYDQLLKKDQEAQRTARLENILGAIRNNMEQIPELKDRIKDLVKEWK